MRLHLWDNGASAEGPWLLRDALVLCDSNTVIPFCWKHLVAPEGHKPWVLQQDSPTAKVSSIYGSRLRVIWNRENRSMSDRVLQQLKSFTSFQGTAKVFLREQLNKRHNDRGVARDRLLEECTKSKNERISETDLGWGQSATALTSPGLTWMPLALMWPKNLASIWKKEHFSILTYKYWSLRHCRTWARWERCSDSDLLKWECHPYNWVRKANDRKSYSFHAKMNTAGALESPKGTTWNSYSPLWLHF